jgi:hypothetical protein
VLEGFPNPLPPGTYTIAELYCDEPGCDCRRVMFCVVSSLRNDIEAVVAYGWESPAFYAKWIGFNDPETTKGLKGPILNVGSPQTKLAPAILNMIKTIILTDEFIWNESKTIMQCSVKKLTAQCQ